MAESLDSILHKIDRRERAAVRRGLTWTAVPALMGLVVVGYSAYRVESAADQVRSLRAEAEALQATVAAQRTELDDLQATLTRTEDELDKARAQLQLTADLARFRHEIGFVDSKMLASRHPRQARILETILAYRSRDTGWRLGGRSPEEGFDSPGFAAFVLREMKLAEVSVTTPEGTPTATARQLFERLPPVGEPGIGDLVFYPAGYVMFHFVDRDDRPFVIGMTPQGIVSLDPDFAEPYGYRTLGRS